MDEKLLKEIQKHDSNSAKWIGSILGKIDKARKEQKHYYVAIMLLQIIILLLLVLKVL